MTWTWRDDVREKLRQWRCFWRHLGHVWAERHTGATFAAVCVYCEVRRG